MNYLKPLVYLALLSSIAACSKKDDVGPITETTEYIDPLDGVLVLNEGGFMNNNASVSFIHSDGNLSLNMFESVNERPMGDVLQSVTENLTEYFFVLNNSGKIERTNKVSMRSIATITGFLSPRYMLIAGNGKALVTNLAFSADNTIDIVNLNTNTIEGNIAVKGSCEEMVKINDRIYVANPGDRKVLVIDANTLTILSSISLTIAPVSMVVDKHKKLWVLSQEYDPALADKLYRIDPVQQTVEATFELNDQDILAFKLRINGERDQLFFLENGVTSMSISDTQVPSASLIKNTFTFMYGLGVDPETNLIYVGDAFGFSSSGKVHAYNMNGELISTHSVGIGPSDFSFR